jgi:hypothetical protein
MLQRMGWKEGLGLGKANQGRTAIIEVSIIKDPNASRRINSTSLIPGADPTITSYKVGVVKIYSSTNSMACFRIKNITI